MGKSRYRHAAIMTGVVAVAAAAGVRVMTSEPAGAGAAAAPDVLRLRGIVRDFDADHPDFDVWDEANAGHFVGLAAPRLDRNRRPTLAGAGREVTQPWYDHEGNPIRPYVADPGLPGGHFNVDIFHDVTDYGEHHEHEFDDRYDITHLDLVNDPHLLFGDVIGEHYPHRLRVRFSNVHHGSGTYMFHAGGEVLTGRTQDGFVAVFEPAALTRFRVNLATLSDLRATQPSRVLGDDADRDDAFSIRIFDTSDNAMIYELAVYHHVSGRSASRATTPSIIDACGRLIEDVPGTLGREGSGAVSNRASFGQWFRDVLGTNLSTTHEITLRREANGVYEYADARFFPADGLTRRDARRIHNELFTYSISGTFTYDRCAGQFFEFEGNDDAWVFIDDRLVIDLGGVATPERQYVAVDRLDLVDGQPYRLDFFSAHRRRTGDSLFKMRTNLMLEAPGAPVTLGYD